MRKDKDLLSRADTEVPEQELSEGVRAYLEAQGITPADLAANFESMRRALEALPDQMDGRMMMFFFNRVLDVYEVQGAARIELLMGVAASSDGVEAKVVRVSEDGELEERELGEVECPCPTCTARREAEAMNAAIKRTGSLH